MSQASSYAAGLVSSLPKLHMSQLAELLLAELAAEVTLSLEVEVQQLTFACWGSILRLQLGGPRK